MKRIAIVSVLFLLLGCGGKQTATAIIFERKATADGKLAIAYMFDYRGQTIIDSALVDNTVLGSDTLNVIFPENNPLQSTPEMLDR